MPAGPVPALTLLARYFFLYRHQQFAGLEVLQSELLQWDEQGVGISVHKASS
jgi:hypothetical protein